MTVKATKSEKETLVDIMNNLRFLSSSVRHFTDINSNQQHTANQLWDALAVLRDMLVPEEVAA